MIQTTPAMRILVAVEPVDSRRGIDGLGAFCRRHFEEDPLAAARSSSPTDAEFP